jgi:hypothetical protein
MTIPDYVNNAYQEYQSASQNLRDFREEVGEVIEKDKELTHVKTTSRRILDNSVLKYRQDFPGGDASLFDDKVSIYTDQEFSILNEEQAIRAILEFCKQYEEKHGVSLLAHFLKPMVTTIREKLENVPEEFGLVNISEDDWHPHWISPAFEIKSVTKVRVANTV